MVKTNMIKYNVVANYDPNTLLMEKLSTAHDNIKTMDDIIILSAAITGQYIDMIGPIINKHVDNTRGNIFQDAFLFAMLNNQPEVIRLLLEHECVCFSYKHMEVLNYAIYNGYVDVVKLVISTSTFDMPNNDWLVMHAINGNHAKMLQALFDHGARLTNMLKEGIETAILSGNIDMMHILATYGYIKPDDDHLVDIAVKNNDVETLKFLIDHCNITGMLGYMLITAIKCGNDDVISVLLDNKYTDTNVSDFEALKLAIRCDNFDVANTILSNPSTDVVKLVSMRAFHILLASIDNIQAYDDILWSLYYNNKIKADDESIKFVINCLNHLKRNK